MQKSLLNNTMNHIHVYIYKYDVFQNVYMYKIYICMQ